MRVFIFGMILLLAGCATQSTQVVSNEGASEATSEDCSGTLASLSGSGNSSREISAEAFDKEESVKQIQQSWSDNRNSVERLAKKHLSIDSKDKRVIYFLGSWYLKNKPKELGRFLLTQLEKDSSFNWPALVLNDLGVQALQEKNRDLALDYFEKATKAEPKIVEAFTNLGALYLESASYSAAEKVFQKAHDLQSESEEAALGLGVALEGQKKWQEAADVYRSYRGSNGSSVAVYYNEALVLGSQLQQKEKAAELMQQYIQRGGKQSAKAREALQQWK